MNSLITSVTFSTCEMGDRLMYLLRLEAAVPTHKKSGSTSRAMSLELRTGFRPEGGTERMGRNDDAPADAPPLDLLASALPAAAVAVPFGDDGGERDEE